MFSRWFRLALAALVAGFALCVTGAVAQEATREGYEFIPAPDEPCGVSCPDPGASLSHANYPPRDDNFPRMFVATESGLRIVRNPHWNGVEPPTAGAWCGINCGDPYRPPGLSNQFRRNDAYPYTLVFVFREGEQWLVGGRNPHWVWREHDEAVELSALYPPLPLLGLAASDAEAELDARGTGRKIVSRSVDRTGVAYHASGNDVFQPIVLRNIGGVLSQGRVAAGPDGQVPKVRFLLGQDGAYPGYLLVSDGAASVRYRIGYEDLVPMALFVDGGGTSLYTLWGTDKLPTDFQREAGFASYRGGRGFVAIEFAATGFADALYFLDTCIGCMAFSDDSSATGNARTASGTEAGSRERSSYINADVGVRFEAQETSAGTIEVTGGIIRFHWSADAGTGKRVAVNRKQPVVRPGELKANVDRWLAENEKAHIIHLMKGVNVREEGTIKGRIKLADAFFLFETLALLRASKRHWPEDWSAFMALLSSEYLVRKYRQPWERYTETFCGVYPGRFQCADRGP